MLDIENERMHDREYPSDTSVDMDTFHMYLQTETDIF